jgi:hypothetical protein
VARSRLYSGTYPTFPALWQLLLATRDPFKGSYAITDTWPLAVLINTGRIAWVENKFPNHKDTALQSVILGKTVLFEPWPSLEDSARLHLVFTSLEFMTMFLHSKVVSLASNPQPGGPGPCIRVLLWQDGPVIAPSTGFPFWCLLRLGGLRLNILLRLHTGILNLYCPLFTVSRFTTLNMPPCHKSLANLVPFSILIVLPSLPCTCSVWNSVSCPITSKKIQRN